MEKFTLNNGVKMPVIGIGTFLMDPDHAEQAVYDALNSGYRMIDTANGYMNEKAVGRGMKKTGVDRKDIFLSTKLWPSVYEDPNAVDDTLRRLGTDYVDLLFIHQPSGNWEAGYRQLEKALKDGKARAIGISNFHDEKLAKLLEVSEVKPQVMQYENHPYYTADDVRKALAPFNVRFMAWYPLGHGDKSLQREPVFTELGRKYGKSPAQVILRWHVQFGNVVIPGSTNPDHIRANADIFDFTLTDEEMDEIAKIKKNIRYYNGSAAQEESYAQMRPDFDSQK
ncbi:aldo/keto reductase [[Clostridium] aminophilum]|uniref:aldo/keto reductase n=1 Tax=[Clostridium] aminophilum TaxID=1526 RepID=UPI003F99DACF